MFKYNVNIQNFILLFLNKLTPFLLNLRISIFKLVHFINNINYIVQT